MKPLLSPRLLAAALLAVVAATLPAAAAAERVVTRSGKVLVGTPRFEKDAVVVVQEDGTEVRLKKTEVERIELTDEEAVPEEATEEGTPEEGQVAEPPEEAPRQPPPSAGPPPWRPRTPPPPPGPPPAYYPPYAPPPPLPIYRERAYDRDGFALALGYHRGLALGGEYQFHTAKHLAFGLGAQLGFEAISDERDDFVDEDEEAFATFGVTGRAYVGRDHRLALEAGFGLNAIDPDLGPDCQVDGDRCAVRNYGPELSAGYQFVSDRGFLFETLLGFAVITDERYADAHGPLNPLFQLSFGYLFH